MQRARLDPTNLVSHSRNTRTPHPSFSRSAYDLYGLEKFAIKKKRLPLIADILQQAYEATDAEWLVYSNSDIGLQRDFYTFVFRSLNKKSPFSAMAVNRVEIPLKKGQEFRASDIEEVYDLGKANPQVRRGVGVRT